MDTLHYVNSLLTNATILLKIHILEQTFQVAFQAVKELLLKLEKPPSGGDASWKPQHTGLKMMIASVFI
jgi:hypothetical protein